MSNNKPDDLNIYQSSLDLMHSNIESPSKNEVENKLLQSGQKTDKCIVSSFVPLKVMSEEICPEKRSLAPLFAKFKVNNEFVRRMMGEFFGTLVLVLLGLGSGCQRTLAEYDFMGERDNTENPTQPMGGFFTSAYGWGISVMMAVFVSGKVSGSHLNPAVSLAMCLRGKLPWKLFGPYVLIQLVGAFFGSLLLLLNYYAMILKVESNRFENSHNFTGFNSSWNFDMSTTGRIFVVRSLFMKNSATGVSEPAFNIMVPFCEEFFSSTFFIIFVLSIIDERNFKLPDYLHPFMLGMSVYLVINSFDLNCNACLNPARDLGPRFMISMTGWGFVNAFSYANYYFLVAFFAPFLGATVGVFVYELFVGSQANQNEHFQYRHELLDKKQMDVIPMN